MAGERNRCQAGHPPGPGHHRGGAGHIDDNDHINDNDHSHSPVRRLCRDGVDRSERLQRGNAGGNHRHHDEYRGYLFRTGGWGRVPERIRVRDRNGRWTDGNALAIRCGGCLVGQLPMGHIQPGTGGLVEHGPSVVESGRVSRNRQSLYGGTGARWHVHAPGLVAHDRRLGQHVGDHHFVARTRPAGCSGGTDSAGAMFSILLARHFLEAGNTNTGPAAPCDAPSPSETQIGSMPCRRMRASSVSRSGGSGDAHSCSRSSKYPSRAGA
jgi:hypothetical protein